MEYFYEAVDATGHVVVGKMEGQTSVEVQRRLREVGYSPRSVVPTGNALIGTDANAPSLDRTLVGAYVAPGDTLVGTVPAQIRAMTGTDLSAASIRASAHPIAAQPRAMTEVGGQRTGGIVMSGNAAQVVARQNRTQPSIVRSGAPTVSGASTLGGVSTRDLMMFFRQLASLVNSGITVYGALDNLTPRTRNASLSTVSKEMADAARNGRRISDVVARYPRIFPDHVAGMVSAGETGGFLDIALAEIADGYDRNIKLYRGAWIPKLMATQAFFLVFLAQPLFTSLFSHFDFAEGIKIYFRLVLFRNLPIAVALYAGGLFAARRLQLPQFRRFRDDLALRLPPFGDLQRQTAILSFLRMLRRLYHAGVAPIQAWEGAMNTASNVVIREKLAGSYELMERGVSLSDAFQATGLFADQVEQLVITGQQSGQVVEMLDQASAYYQEKADEATGKSRFMMFRIGLLAMLILGGATMLWLVHTYFQGMFQWTDNNFGADS